jgi:hypothetical protein
MGRESAVAGAYLLLTLAATYPLFLHPLTTVPPGGDTWLYYWDLWWVKRSLLEHLQSPFVTDRVHYPYGAALYFHTLNVLPSAAAAPIAAVLGLPAAYNAIVLASFVLSGYFTYRLALDVIDATASPASRSRTLAAFVAGAAFTFSSYRMGRLFGHLDLLFTPWLPLTALLALRLRDRPSRVLVVAVGLCLAATALTAWYYVLCLTIFMVIVAADRRAAAVRLAAAFAVFLAVISPVLVPMLAHGGEGRTSNPALDASLFSPDLLAFVTPPYFHSIWGSLVDGAYHAFGRPGSGIEGVAFLGFAPIALALLAIRERRLPGVWIAVIVVFAALALGPDLHVAGWTVPVVSWVMPYRLLAAAPYLDIARVPARFVVMAAMGVAMLAAFGARRILAGASPGGASAIASSLVALIACESLVVPLPTQTTATPRFFERLRAEPGPGVILEAPIPSDPARLPVRMLWQTVHERPVFGGYLSRGLPPIPFDAVPGFAPLASRSQSNDDIVAYDHARLNAIGAAILSAYGTDYIVIEKSLARPDETARLQQAADAIVGASARIADDEAVTAYRVAAAAPLSQPEAWLDSGWSYLERRSPGSPADRWRWMADRARMGIIAPAASRLRIDMRLQSFRRPRQVRFSIDGRTIAEVSAGLDVAPATTNAFDVAAGTTFVTIESVEGSTPAGADPRRLSVAFHELRLIR